MSAFGRQVNLSGSSAQNEAIFDALRDIYDSVTSQKVTGFFRVEALFVRLENTGEKLADGSSCDTIGHCDPIVSAFVD
jgi:hypothetical protein